MEVLMAQPSEWSMELPSDLAPSPRGAADLMLDQSGILIHCIVWTGFNFC